MGGSTNTVLHMLAIAHEAGIEYDLDRIQQLSLRTPNLCRVAPSSHYHVEDVHNSGGISTLGASTRAPRFAEPWLPDRDGQDAGREHRRVRRAVPERQPGGSGTGGGCRGRDRRRRPHNVEGMNVPRPGRHDPRPIPAGTRIRSLRLHPGSRHGVQPGGRTDDPVRQPGSARRRGQVGRGAARNAAAFRPGGDLRVRDGRLFGHCQRTR
jgi:hypothetical protein